MITEFFSFLFDNRAAAPAVQVVEAPATETQWAEFVK